VGLYGSGGVGGSGPTRLTTRTVNAESGAVVSGVQCQG
jgi:hypothetical protein